MNKEGKNALTTFSAAKATASIFGIAVINGVFLVIGSLILVYFFDLNNPDLFMNSFFFSILSLLLMIFTGVAYDIQNSARDVVV